jgi:hypothetical protein
MADKELAKLNQAELALENAEDIQDFINLRTYGKTLNVLLEAQERKEDAQRAKIFQIKAQIKAGQWLDENVAHKGGDAATLSNDTTAIPEGITRDESSRWQKQYKAGMDKFDEYIDKCLAEDKEISEAFLKNALLLNINLASIGLDDENNLGLSGQWHFTNGYYSEYQNNNKSLIKGGRLDKLIGFLLPRMDEMVKDMCEKEIVAKRGY